MSDNFTFISNGVLSTYSYNNQGAFNPVANLVFTDSVSGNTVSINTTSISIANSTANINIVNPNTSQIASSNYWLNANGKWAQITSSVSTLDANNSNYLLGKTWNIPGQIGSSTPNTGNFTTVSSTTNTVTFGSSLYIVSNGNVGLGNSTPADKLSVQGSVSITGNTTITGNLIVTGTTVTVNTTTLDVKDLNITVAKGAGSSSAANGAGLTVDGANALLYYNDSTTSWISNLNLKLINSNTFIGSHPSYSNSYSAFWREGNDYALLASDTNTFLNSPSGAIYFRKGNVNSGYFDGSQNFYAKNLYDIDNNSYYVDPASSSVVNNLTVSGTLSTTGGSSSTTSLSAPIFYDYNNTGYYTDPASTSVFNQITVSNINSGTFSVLGGYGSGSGPGINIENQTTYARLAFWGLDFYDWNVGSLLTLDGNARAPVDFRSPIFYDYNDTGYYCNPNDSSNFVRVYTNDWFRAYGAKGLYSQDYGNHWYSTDSGYWSHGGNGSRGYGGIRILYGYENTVKGYLYWDGSGFGLLNSSGNWGFRMEDGNNNCELYRITYANDIRPYILYDRDDTGYYLNPNGDSRLANIYNSYVRSYGDIRADSNVYAAGRFVAGEGQTSSWIEMRDTDEGTRYLHNNSGTIGFVGSHGSWRFRMADDGNVVMGTYQDWLSNQIRSNIYYDHSDTGYYCDPNGTSNFNVIRANGAVIQTVHNRVDSKSTYAFATAGSTGTFISVLDTAITPRFSSSKILVQYCITYEVHHDTIFRLYRNVGGVDTMIGTNVNDSNYWSGIWSPCYDADNSSTPITNTLFFLDSPGTTSAVTYKLMIQSGGVGATTFYLNRTISSAGQGSYEVAISQVMLQEIGG